MNHHCHPFCGLPLQLGYRGIMEKGGFEPPTTGWGAGALTLSYFPVCLFIDTLGGGRCLGESDYLKRMEDYQGRGDMGGFIENI